ncbi:MAG TPA: hypothetical protein VEY33_05035 [Gemmatimonadota bacterium]|nr:hypothetical protein [Gemmatimonadota bacterium]
MKAPAMLTMLAAMGLYACQDDPSRARQASPVAARTQSVATAPTCPCWDAEALVGALPEADACFDQTAAEMPFLSVDLFDPAAATQTQAFTRYDAGTAEAGSCRLVVVGTEGLVAEIAAAAGLPRADYEGCASLLAERARATAAGC